MNGGNGASGSVNADTTITNSAIIQGDTAGVTNTGGGGGLVLTSTSGVTLNNQGAIIGGQGA